MRKLVLVLLLASGCGGGSVTPPGNQTPATIGEACNLLFGGALQKATDCGFYLRPVDRDQFLFICGQLQKLVEGGTLVYDRSKYAACKAGFDAATCSSPLPADGGACNEMIKGNKAAGAACVIGAECVSGSCDESNGCPGACRPIVELGGDCSGGGTCASGLICHFQGMSATCKEPAAAGQSCAATRCLNDLYCDANSICQARKTGGACTSGSECAGTYECRGGSCVRQKRIGDPCVVDDECQTRICDMSRCQDLPRLGGACGKIGGHNNVQCYEGYCDITDAVQQTGICKAAIAAGGACDPTKTLCAVGTTCTNGVCTARMCF